MQCTKHQQMKISSGHHQQFISNLHTTFLRGNEITWDLIDVLAILYGGILHGKNAVQC